MNDNAVKEIDLLFVARRTRFLGIAILVGMFLVFVFGLFVSYQNVNEELAYINLYSFIFCAVLCGAAVLLKRIMFAKINRQNFANQYFNAHVIPFALCDLGGLVCIMSNLFVNNNIIYAAAGFLLTAAVMIYNFPKDSDYSRLGF
ncbi:MAG: hypothetical protein LWX07_06535 [Bacteroidetes bacterium]|nr:hypothetical protein [Bacteroidota bacterium]